MAFAFHAGLLWKIEHLRNWKIVPPLKSPNVRFYSIFGPATEKLFARSSKQQIPVDKTFLDYIELHILFMGLSL